MKAHSRAQLSAKGSDSMRTTIPPEVVAALKLKAGDEVTWTVTDGQVTVRKSS